VTPSRPAWLDEPAVRRLLKALSAAKIEARFVGGCVRDWLLRQEIGDLDLATPARPEAVIAALTVAKIKALPTGLAHGTVTAVVGSRPFEITTLRRDVETFGRRARVAFDADWAADAARRDFTINAIYLAPDGTIFDPVGGRIDLAAHRVRFVGDAATRIAEDVLRILRYYRFEARFGGGAGDAVARDACRAAIEKLPTLSRERVSRELLRLLAAPDPVRALALMRDDGVLAALLPEATRLDRLERLRPLSADPLLRLAALIDSDRAGAAALAERLRLSNTERDRLADLAQPWPLDADADARAQRLVLYRLGHDRFRDLALLLAADGRLTPPRLREFRHLADTWTIPAFPLGGADVIALGISPGPRVGRLLDAVKRWWEEGDFAADRAACLARLNALAARP
jgi:poly(A) polymerase